MGRVQKLTTFRRTFAHLMRTNGFPSVNNERMQDRLMAEGLWEVGAPTRMVQTNEMIYNRGINSPKSSFCVFVKSNPDKSVTVYYFNPDSSENAPMKHRYWSKGADGEPVKGRVKPGQQYMVRKVYKGDGNPERAAEEVAKDVLHYASLKPETEYWMFNHEHCGWMPQGYAGKRKFYDDGMSQFEDQARAKALFCGDGLAISCHNSFERKKFMAMEIMLEEMGMIAVPGMELTAPNVSYNRKRDSMPNGTHLIIHGKDFMTLDEVSLLALRRRSDFSMPPFNDSVPLHKILPLLHDRLHDEIFIGAAHALNLHSSEHPIYSVGMISSVEMGQYSLQEIFDLFEYIDAVEAWNIGMGDKRAIPRLKNRQLREFVHETVTKAHGSVIASPNAFTSALAAELGIENEFFATDAHYTPPMNYVVDGLPEARGHTVLDLSGVLDENSEKPNSADLITWLRQGLVKMQCHVFTEVRDGFLQVPWGRREMNSWTQKVVKRLQNKRDELYGDAIWDDFRTFKLDGGEIGNLMRSYGIENARDLIKLIMQRIKG